MKIPIHTHRLITDEAVTQEMNNMVTELFYALYPDGDYSGWVTSGDVPTTSTIKGMVIEAWCMLLDEVSSLRGNDAGE